MSESNHETAERPLTPTELQLATLLYKARTALWREWVEGASGAAKKAFDETDPKGVKL